MNRLPENELASESVSLAPPGFRLDRLEVMNWGTFDSTDGEVHVVRLNGQNALLVGHNETGKSTLVDALLTLLVHPSTRNYNLAAGGRRRERGERSYIKGAYDRRGSEEEHRGDVQYLRPANGHYSVLLACFRNAQSGSTFTLAQVLHPASDGGVDKLYCFAPRDRSIAEHCSGLRSMDKLSQQMQKRGFTKTTKGYTEYFEWFRKVTGVQPQAMEIFNQTVAVKDIQRLNEFLRRHMLEAKAWGDRVDSLLRHFQDLSEAHRDLLRVRRQHDLLTPIAEKGAEYIEKSAELDRAERIAAALDCFICQRTIDLLGASCELWREEQVELAKQRTRLATDIAEAREDVRRLTNEIEREGGERLQLIPELIARHQAQGAAKRESHRRYHDGLRAAGIEEQIESAAHFASVRELLPNRVAALETEIAGKDQARTDLFRQRDGVVRGLESDQAELESLKRRSGNLPSELVELRRQLCDELRLSERDLTFAAELMAVRAADRAWEASLEMVLRSFALTLLVSHRHYKVVSGYIDRTRLRDGRGRGQRLVYHRVAERSPAPAGASRSDRLLFQKLEFKEGHLLLPWVKAEVQDRFDYRCCETVEEFQDAAGRALTRERHVKSGHGRHEKDDRERAVDPRTFVLGWDNQEKKNRLAESVRQHQEQLGLIDRQLTRIDEWLSDLRSRRHRAGAATEVLEFAAIDFKADESEVATLRQQQKALEDGSQAIRLLKDHRAKREQQIKDQTSDDSKLADRAAELKKDLRDAEQLLQNCQRLVSASKNDGSLERHLAAFPDIEAAMASPLTIDDLWRRPLSFERSLQQRPENLRKDLAPVAEGLRRLMSSYVKDPSSAGAPDLQPDVRYLNDFVVLLDRIREEDLPRYEERFRERLNEKVGDEVAALRSALRTECTEIEERIDLLNDSLRQVAYRSGAHMRLQAKPAKDREIIEFKQALEECVSGQFDGTPRANEERYLRIEKLIHRLQDEDAWRQKVTDVRNWFDFAAVVIDDQTGAQLSYYEDSVGQSGGGKAKLAFTILVAAIAYQYDLDPQQPESNRFHFVVIDEMFSLIGDRYSVYALDLFEKFKLQLLIVAPLDARARITEPYVGSYLHVVKDERTSRSHVYSMTAREFHENQEMLLGEQASNGQKSTGSDRTRKKPKG